MPITEKSPIHNGMGCDHFLTPTTVSDLAMVSVCPAVGEQCQANVTIPRLVLCLQTLKGQAITCCHVQAQTPEHTQGSV